MQADVCHKLRNGMLLYLFNLVVILLVCSNGCATEIVLLYQFWTDRIFVWNQAYTPFLVFIIRQMISLSRMPTQPQDSPSHICVQQSSRAEHARNNMQKQLRLTLHHSLSTFTTILVHIPPTALLVSIIYLSFRGIGFQCANKTFRLPELFRWSHLHHECPLEYPLSTGQ